MKPKKSERLYYELITLDHLENYLKMHQNPNVTRFLGVQPDSTIEAHTERFKERIEFAEQNPGFGVFCVYLNGTNEFIGHANINQLFKTDERHIGYVIDEPFWGKGYATEIAKHFVQYAFESLGLDEVCAVCDKAHIASQRILSKAGLKYIEDRVFADEPLMYYCLQKASYEVQN